MLESYFKQYFFTFHLVVLAAMAFVLSKTASALIGHALRPDPAVLEAGPRPVVARAPDEPRTPKQALLDRNLFGAEREDLRPVEAEAGAEAAKVADMSRCSDKSNIKAALVATVVHSDPTLSLAVFQDTAKNEPDAYRIGDAFLEDSKIHKIDWRRVEVEHAGRCEYFSIEDGEAETKSESLVSSAPPPTGATEEGAAPDVKFMEGARKIKETEYEIPRTEIDNVLSNLSAVATHARIVPSFKDGKGNGFKLFSIRPGSLYSKIGIQNGDIIQKINGYDMSSPDKALEIYNKLKDAQAVTVDILRRGKTETLTYNIR